MTLQDVEWAVGINFWSVKMCGIWRSENNSHWQNVLLNLLVPLYVLITATNLILPETLAIFRVWGDMSLTAEILIVFLPQLCTIYSISVMWFKRKVIVTMLIFIREDWSKKKSEEEQKVMIKHARTSRIITFGGYLAISWTNFIYCFPILFGNTLRSLNNITDTGSRPMIFPTAYSFDVYETPIYELAIIGQIIAVTIVGLIYTMTGTLFAVIVIHVCSQLENLAVRIDRMMKINVKVPGKFQNLVTFNVKEHQRLIRFVDMIENSFSIILLMIVPAFTIGFCLQGLTLIDAASGNVKGSMLPIIFAIVYMGYIAFVMFMFSLVGQILEGQSEDIQHAAYGCEWYDLKPKEAAMIIPILIRAQRPLRITAGKFVPLNMETFATLLKTTAGYLSCLLAVH